MVYDRSKIYFIIYIWKHTIISEIELEFFQFTKDGSDIHRFSNRKWENVHCWKSVNINEASNGLSVIFETVSICEFRGLKGHIHAFYFGGGGVDLALTLFLGRARYSEKTWVHL